ncbi:hypothetical protein UFOVP36_39 [uncultured Caudovirales phage]|uniref:Uncharacterized protein n=1 Tax=uncultured Caudovirales phage TaxID=2100421 RepID=A0A6J5KKX1_9CAUD|nr:hypothetical protein UFOVP36_39 [uncultured Caudovirales phage]
MSTLFSNNAVTTLATGILSTALSMTVATGTGALFPTHVYFDDYTYLTITDAANPTTFEIVKATYRSGDVFTIQRAQQGTTALTFGSGSGVSLRLTAGLLQEALGAKNKVNLVAYNGEADHPNVGDLYFDPNSAYGQLLAWDGTALVEISTKPEVSFLTNGVLVYSAGIQNAGNALKYGINTAGGAFSVNLPLVNLFGPQQIVKFYDAGASDLFGGFATNAFTLLRNGATINGVADDVIFTTKGVGFTAEYVRSISTWRLYNGC